MTKALLIAGGGIGGAATALAFERAGIEFTLFEGSSAFRESGAGVSLWPNATRVLQSLGVLDAIQALGATVRRFDLRLPGGEIVAQTDVDRFATPAVCVHRADLHRCLCASLPPGRLRAGFRLQSFSPGAEEVALAFAGGATARGDGLVGADGIHSTVRSQLHGAVPPRHRGYTIWRGLAPEGRGVAAGRISETWGAGRRFGIMPLGRGRVCWYATANSPPAPPYSPAEDPERIARLFAGWHDPIPGLIASTDPADIIKMDARDRPSLPSWGKARVTLLGDAAHPITPNLGQGACLAIEDAACLARCLAAAPDVPSAFRAYEARRLPRATALCRLARRIGVVGQCESRWLVPARNRLAALAVNLAARRQLNAIHGYVG